MKRDETDTPISCLEYLEEQARELIKLHDSRTNKQELLKAVDKVEEEIIYTINIFKEKYNEDETYVVSKMTKYISIYDMYFKANMSGEAVEKILISPIYWIHEFLYTIQSYKEVSTMHLTKKDMHDALDNLKNIYNYMKKFINKSYDL